MKKKVSKKGVGGVELAAIGAGLAGLAAASYFFLGPKGESNRKQTQAWASKMKSDVVKQLKKAKAVSKPIYEEIINMVANEYAKNEKAGKKEIALLAKDMKKHWKTISTGAKTVTKDVKKAAKKITR